MRINPITNQNFKALNISKISKFSSEQDLLVEDVFQKTSKPQENYNERSTLEMLEQDYEMDLFVEPNVDKKSINMYFAEKSHLAGELSDLPKLTPVGIYDNVKNIFDVIDIEDRLIEIENGSNRNALTTISTFLMAICVVLIPILSLSSALRNKNGIKNLERNTNVKELVIDTAKNVAKDTTKFFEIIK